MTRWRGPFEDRFWAKVDASGDCWMWTGAGSGLGGQYGHTSVPGGGYRGAHRVAYELLVGPIPDGMQLDHLCRNKRCVNPDHLEVVTQRTNLRRAFAGPTARARSTACHRGHPFTPENTYISPGRQTRSCRTCMADRSARRVRRTVGPS